MSSTAQRLLRLPTARRRASASTLARKRVNKVALALSLAAMAFGVFWLVWILWETVQLGIGGMTWAALSQMTPPPNEAAACSTRSGAPS
jgi:phosphate transport system permease protein